MARDPGWVRRRAWGPVYLDRAEERAHGAAQKASRVADPQRLRGNTDGSAVPGPGIHRLVPIPRRLPRLPITHGPRIAVAADARPRPRSAERG